MKNRIKKGFKEFMGILLAMTMTVALIPASAFASEDGTENLIDVEETSTSDGESGGCTHELTTEGTTPDGLYDIVTCLNCGEELSRTAHVSAHTHSYTETARIPATCTTAGEVQYGCECGVFYTETIPTTEHTYGEATTVAATCTTGGYDIQFCTECGNERVSNQTSALGHDYQEFVITLPDGRKITKSRCTRCNDVKDETTENAHKHTYVVASQTAATCTTAGSKTYTCSDPTCNDTYTETVSATGHNFHWETVTTATCTRDGLKKQVCSKCGAEGETETTPASGHTWSNLIEDDVPATCYTEGLGRQICTKCHQAEEVTLPKLNHNYEHSDRFLVDSKPSTCTEAGYLEYVCENCGIDTEKVTLPLASHQYVTQTVNATCTQPGYTEDVCAVCNDKKNRTVIPATGHEYKQVIKTPATCTEASDEKYECEHCGNVKHEHEDPATGHSYGEFTVTKQPTCNATGTKTRVCSSCSHEDTETIDKEEHNYQWVTTKEATVRSEGVESFKCTKCGDVKNTRPIDKLTCNHNWGTATVVSAPTCSEKGVAKHVCTKCDREEQYELPTVSHEYNAPTVDRESTCVTNGEKSAKCKWCGCKDESSIEELPLAAHTYSDSYTTDKEATCTAEGSESRHCTVDGCNAKTDQRAIPKKAHTLTVTNTVPATCTQNGTITKSCAHCEYTETDTTSLPKLGHDYSDLVTEATCTEQGYHTHVCSRCNDTYKDEYTDAKGHTNGSAVRENEKAPTCTKDGSHDEVVYCTVCGDEVSRNTVTDNATGHDYNDVVTEPTCTAGGYTTYTCSHCGSSYIDDATEAKGHTNGLPYRDNEVASTCSAFGHYDEVVSCTVCGEEISRVTKTIAKAEHKHSPIVKENVVEPTCTKTGSHDEVTYCSVCDEELSRTRVTDAVQADKHTLVPAENNDTDPTCTTAGKRTDKCSECGADVEVEIAALGHDYKVETTKASTYDEEGLKTYTCTRCDDTYTEKVPRLVREAASIDNSEEVVTTSSDVTEVATEAEGTSVEETTPATITNTENQPVNAEETDEASLISELANHKEERVVIEVKNPTLSANVLKAIADNNNEVVLKADSFTWYINGASIIDAKDVDLNVSIGEAKIDSETLNEFVKESDHMLLSLAYDGPFGFDAVLEVKVDDKFAGQFAELYYYNNGSFDKMGTAEVIDGTVKFEFSHASEYVILFGQNAQVVATGEESKEVSASYVKTTIDRTELNESKVDNNTDSRNIVFIVITALAVVAVFVGGILIIKRKQIIERQ